MKTPVLLRLDPELIDRIEAYRVREGLKATAEAMRQLIEVGLAAPVPKTISGAGLAGTTTGVETKTLPPAAKARAVPSDGVAHQVQLGPTRPTGAFLKPDKKGR